MQTQQPSQNQLKLNVNANELEDIVCSEENCGCPYFEEAIRFKRLPALQSPNGQEQLVPIPVFLCKACGRMLVR